MNEDIDKMLEVAVKAASDAGRILKDGFGTTFSFQSKSGAHDLVTEFDKLAEDIIVSELKKEFPGHAFLGEESGEVKPVEPGSVRWIIDPLDGTLNFCHSIPFFGVSIGAELNGELICGVVYNPEADEMFTASKGNGARLNGEKLHVSDADDLSRSVLAIGFPFNTESDPGHCISKFAAIAGKGAQLLRMGSSAMNLAYVAAGRFDGFWETSCFPWDVAAGVIIAQEAGALATNLDGGTFDISGDGIIVGNKEIHASIQSIVGE